MSTDHTQNPEREAFQRLLETSGADRARWPAGERLRFAHLLARDAEARRMLSEAEALDRVLDRAPAVDAGRREKLAARILQRVVEERGAAADASGAPQPSPGAAVVPLSVARKRDASLDERSAHAAPFSSRQGGQARLLPAAALLAASLAAGLFIGMTGAMSPALDGVASVLMSAGDSDYELVLANDVLATGEESL